jgi:serine/threonine-protein kinase RsbW
VAYVALDCELPPLATSATEARRATRAALATMCDAATLDALAIVVTELATNAIDHAGSAFRLRVVVEEGEASLIVRIEVTDRDQRHPTKSAMRNDELRGRGLHLIEELTARWGVESLPAGKRVYAELPC